MKIDGAKQARNNQANKRANKQNPWSAFNGQHEGLLADLRRMSIVFLEPAIGHQCIPIVSASGNVDLCQVVIANVFSIKFSVIMHQCQKLSSQ
jgi:hypothetical protein